MTRASKENLVVGLAILVAGLLITQTRMMSRWMGTVDVWRGKAELRLHTLETTVQAYHPLVPVGTK